MRQFEAAAVALYRCGYSPLPIYAGEQKPGLYSGVSEDGTKGPWYDFKGWRQLCIERGSEAAVAAWGRMSDAKGGGIGVACGYGGLVAVDIDDEALVEPLLAVLPRALVAKRGSKGLTAFYRGEHPHEDADWWAKRNYRTADKRGLLDFLAVGAQTVAPPSQHPKTGKAYQWITERTLLDTPLADLPVFTSEHRAKMEEVLRQHGWDAPASRQSGAPVERPERSQGAGSGDDAFDTAVRNARHQWLPLLGLESLRRIGDGWRSVASFRPSGSGKPTRRGLSLSVRDTGEIVDHGTGRGYNNVTLVAECLHSSTAEAFAWLRAQIGWIDAPDPVPVVQASYRDNRVSLEDATARLQALTGPEFAEAILNGITARNLVRLNPPLILPVHPVTVSRVEAGAGKTHAAGKSIAEHTQSARRFVYAVPNHKLAAQIAADAAVLGVKAEVYRAFDKDDPFAPSHKMCRRPDAYAAARALWVGARSAVCERRIDDKVVRCLHANVCGMERQREARPSEWVVPAALLFTKRPEFFSEHDALVIDESFIDNAIGETVTLDIPALLNSKIEGCNDAEHDAVTRFRLRLVAAIKANKDGPMHRAALLEQDIAAEDAYWIGKLEQRRITSSVLSPSMREVEIKTVAYRDAARNKLARAAGTVWDEIAGFLWEGETEDFYGDRSRSGRITVVGGTVSVTPLRTIHPSWRDAPTLILDATAPPASLVAIALGVIEHPGLAPVVTEQPDIAAKWPDHVHVSQIVGASVSMGKVGLGPKAKPENEKGLLHYIHFRAALASPARIGLVSYKGLLERIAGQLPVNVDVLHFGALSGLNSMKDVAGLIVIGRLYPPPKTIEAQASVFAGRPVEAVGNFYPKRPGGIRLADGSAFAIEVDYHPDPTAEALRWRTSVGELLQAIGRLRPHRRSEPCWLDIVCDVPLPITVHEAVRWGDVAPGAVGAMAAGGVILTNRRDIASAFAGLSERQGRSQGGEVGYDSLLRSYKRSVPNLLLHKFTYRKDGPGQKTNTGYYLPAILPGGVTALRSWMEDRLRVSLASLEFEQV